MKKAFPEYIKISYPSGRIETLYPKSFKDFNAKVNALRNMYKDQVKIITKDNRSI